MAEYIDKEKVKEFIKQYFYAVIDSGEREVNAVDCGVELCRVISDMPAAELAIKALKKQIPKKIELWNGQCACPNCNKLFGSYYQLKTLIHWEMPYCKFCGQALDWSETND